MCITSASEPIQPGRVYKNDSADILQFSTLKIPFSHLQVRLVEHLCSVCLKVLSSLLTGIFTDSSLAGLGSKYAGLESEPELSDLMNEVASKVPAKWKQISIQLELTPSDQECFMALSPNDPLQCFTSVFKVWKSRAIRPYTWSTVIEALESPAVDEMRLAQELRTKLKS